MARPLHPMGLATRDHPFGRPFLAPDGGTCSLGGQDVAFLLADLEVRRYYWHVQGAREVCEGGSFDPLCRYDEVWGPVAYFESVAPPPPPLLTGCSVKAVDAMADNFLIPYAKERYPSYYEDIAGAVDWTRLAPVCRDLDGDGDRELIVRLVCCTGGSLSHGRSSSTTPPGSGGRRTPRFATPCSA